jgi:hypothetical protein
MSHSTKESANMGGSKKKLSDTEREENYRFANRLRFDQPSKTWVPPEPRSLPPSIWPEIERQCRLFGIRDVRRRDPRRL